MYILQVISKHATPLLPIVAIVGFFVPDLSNAVLPHLPNILFFLMFFTLLGVDQSSLFKRLYCKEIWAFAIFQSVITSLAVTVLAYAVGLRGDLLLAVSALGATSPLFASGAIVNSMGFNALKALAKTIIATFVMPATLLVVLWALATDSATLDLVAYFKRLIIYILCPIVLSVLVKKYMPKATLDRYYPKVAEFNIVLVLCFPLGLSAGFRDTFDNDPHQALTLFLLGNAFVFVVFVITYLTYYRLGKQRAIIASTVCTGRNMVLTIAIAGPFLGSMFLPLVGAIVLSMYSLPLIAKMLINRLKIKEIPM